MKKRVISMMLCAALMTPMFPVKGFAADSGVTGSIKATLRFDYPQRVSTVKEKNINVNLYRGKDLIGEFALNGEMSGEVAENASVTLKNVDGTEISNESEIGYLDVDINSLPLGDYSFEFAGDGYLTYTTPKITLNDYSRQVVIGTGDKTFSIGDVNRDSKVNKTDRDLISEALGKDDTEDLGKYDLNGDGRINIIDLAYVNHQIDAKGDAMIYDTALIAQKAVNTEKIEENLDITVAAGGSVGDMFVENNESPVVLKPKGQDSVIAIPIEFEKEPELEQIEVISPDGDGAITAGVAEVTYEENGKEITEQIPFDNSRPDDIEFLNNREGTQSVVISLGKRVPVKKIIINVTKVEGTSGTPQYAVVQEVKFLKEIVPENPAAQSLSVKNVKTDPKSKSVQLKWDEFPNIMGYKVHYGLSSDELNQELTVDVNKALVTGLKNLKTYYFAVTPISDGWEGGASEIVSAMPLPNSAPKKPDMLKVTPMDGALALSWKATEDATYYRVFIKEAEGGQYAEYGSKISTPAVTIAGLTNGTEYLMYVIAGNDIGESPRSAEATGTPVKEEIEAPDIPTLHMIDKSNIENVQLAHKDYYDHGQYPNGFNVWNVADGDYGTHWTARAFWESNKITFTFREAKEMNYMVYVPRLDGKYRKSLEKYSIEVWDEEGNQKQLVQNKNIPINSNTTGYMILPFEKSKVKKLAVTVNQWAGSPTGVSLAEAVFYESDNLASDVRALFANDTYTELSDDVKADKNAALEKINSLRAQANDASGYYVDKDVLLDELNLAEELLNGNSAALGRVQNGVQSRSTGADSAKYSQSGSDLQPLGVIAYATPYAEKNKKAQTKVTIYADIPEGETVRIIPTQHYAEANAWRGSAITLRSGRNIIDIPQIGSQNSERGGSLYLLYSGKRADEISLQIRQGVIQIPMLELSDWYSITEETRKEHISAYVEELTAYTATYSKQMNTTGIHNATEISMPNVLLSVTANKVLAGIKPTGATNEEAAQTLYNNVLAWEELMHIVNTTQGIDNTLEKSDMQSRQNIRYMQMFANAFMYAAGNHIGIGYGSVSGTVCGKPVSMTEGSGSNSLFGWGIAHEIGHNMDKLGKAEITNNIYSLMAQTYDGKQNTLRSRLEKSNKYAGIYKKVAEKRPGMANDVFVQLGMYWQLHLAYDDGDNPMDFYNRLFKAWKSGGISAPSGDEKFAIAASQTANKNLTEFFESWGMRLSESTKSKLSAYPEETRKIQYLNDNSRRYRLNGGEAVVGTTTASAAIDAENDKRVNLTFSTDADGSKILGWEIRRNGKTIAFVGNTAGASSESYSDVIGSANNMAFTYTVQAIDMLGNEIGETANAGQVRISYVKTVDPSEYTIARESDGTIKAVMTEQKAVSGLKITGAPSEGEFSVSITRETGETVTAKDGNFANNETPEADYYVTYFNKPGADASDTRIWTYDAKEITITGIPEEAKVEFISYAGDNIEFTSDAAVGRLKNDYAYDNGEGGQDVIEAGTLVITGTYRGDPVYNTVQINGSFVSVDPETSEQTVTERPIDGYALLFAEIPEDGEVSDISDGIFLFVPNVQKEAELQNKGDALDCSAQSLLPAQIKAELYRTDTAESTESKRLTSDTIWIDSPADDAMPEIILE